MKLKLKQQITLLLSLALIIPVLLISSMTIYQMRNKAEVDIESYREEALNKLKLYLKHITDVAYGLVEIKYKEAIEYQKNNPDITIDSLMAPVLTELSIIKFDNGEGYFWVTDNKEPYPTMIMHAEKKNLKGSILDDPKYNVEKKLKRNIYQVRAEYCNTTGDAFVEYVMKKPGTTEEENKISYSRLLPGLNWIISTGFYTDQIQEAIVLKQKILSDQINGIIYSIIFLGIIILTAGLVVGLYFSNKLTTAIITIQEKLKSLGLGHQVEEVKSVRNDEVGNMTHSLNVLVTGLRSYTAFAKDIGQGTLDSSFEPLSREDVLGNELIDMRKKLKLASEEKNTRDWVNEGLSKLGDVLRANNINTKDLAEEVLIELIKYLKVNQGAFFLVTESNTEEGQHLEQVATYAYNRKKFLNNKIAFGDGLVGQCVLEKHTFHLKEIPKNYVSITSGLGDALPQTILIVPLIHNEIVYGVIEMASFKRLEDFQVKFVEKVAESIASTVATVQVNEKTRKLLEHSQELSEEMKAQEEELRQNQEELQATQEQMQRRQLELEQENRMLRENLHATSGV